MRASAIPGLLAAQPTQMRNPFNGEPFGWDAASSQITYAPAAGSYWKVDMLRVDYPAPRRN